MLYPVMVKLAAVAVAAVAALTVAGCQISSNQTSPTASDRRADETSVKNTDDKKEPMTQLQQHMHGWIAQIVSGNETPEISIKKIAQGWGDPQLSQSINREPLNIHGRPFTWGIGTHSHSELLLTGPAMTRIRGFVGVDENSASRGRSLANIVFSIESQGKVLWQSQALTLRNSAVAFDVPLDHVNAFTLRCKDLRGNDVELSHGDWAEPVVTLATGKEVKLGALEEGPILMPRTPFSYTYDGRPSKDLMRNWKRQASSKTLADGSTLHSVTWQDPATALECTMEMKEFPDFPAAEWVMRFHNAGNAKTPILQNIQSMDLSGLTNRKVILQRSQGSHFSKDDFLFTEDTATPGTSIVTTPVEGRSSTQWLPFQNIVLTSGVEGLDFRVNKQVLPPDKGMIVGLGWSGSWKTTLLLDRQGTLNLQAGFEKAHLSLLPGETIRTPSVLLLNWQGEAISGNNMLRQFVIKYHRPTVNGKPAMVPITNGTWGGMPTAGHLEHIARIAKERLPYDYYWIDAGWYGPPHACANNGLDNDWSMHVGNWNINTVVHPNGFAPIADAVHKAGMKFLLWFEPERAIWGTPITQEHPEWFLGPRVAGQNTLLDLGNPEARQWATRTVSDMIKQYGIDCYRQDFNMDPLPLWRAADAPDRIGMTEIKHIEGLYAFWDELRTRYPNLLIDNCASGGRRIDLETMSRSIPLWRSDVQCFMDYDTDCSQTQSEGLNRWVPLNACGTIDLAALSEKDAVYRLRSTMSTGIVFHIFAGEDSRIEPTYPMEWHRRMMAQYQRAQPMFYGDFYPLTPTSQSKNIWAVHQYHRSDLNQGIILAFRRSACPYTSSNLQLKGLDAAAQYEFEDADTGVKTVKTGREIMDDGLPIAIESRGAASLIYYKLKSK